MKSTSILTLVTASALILASCVSSVSTKTVKREGLSQADKGRAILDKAWEAQGMATLKDHSTYEVLATDHWKGAMGKMAKMWKDNETDLHLKYAIGTFDSQVTMKSGKEQGLTAGLQSWKYYEKEAAGDVEFMKTNAKKEFGLTAYQYFFELTDRLRTAPLITYAGEKEFKGNTYDLVFITWQKLKKHMAHDQYTVWVNRNTGMMEYCEFTIHDPFLPGGAMIPGSIEFADMRDVDGIQISFTQYIYAGSPKEDQDKYLHRLTLDDFKWDSFDVTDLRPDPAVTTMGDEKPL